MRQMTKEEYDRQHLEAAIPAEDYDFVQKPPHYTSGSKEVIDMMVDIWGREKVAAHCEMCAFKYRMRVGKKPDQPIQRDLEKAQWYENKAAELRVDKLPF